MAEKRNERVDDFKVDGTLVAGASASLIGFYGVTPVDRPETVADASGALENAVTTINLIIDRLQELGLIK